MADHLNLIRLWLINHALETREVPFMELTALEHLQGAWAQKRQWSDEDAQQFQRACDLVNAVIAAYKALLHETVDLRARALLVQRQTIHEKICSRLSAADWEDVQQILSTYPSLLEELARED
ncbi:hypothetical protein AB0F46_41510 [Streptomyces sp. NPDC026665]|uniref:hypothetical protein n=1 Tax=Streptomyces sp. NPDC026665 TaxID=3154798 RepID=UPI0033DA2679